MAMTVKQAFEQYKANLEITDRQESLVAKRRSGVVAALRQELTLHSDHQDGLVIGSWARHTLTRYLSEGDVDVLIVLHYGKHKEWDTPDGTVKALDRFKTILDRTYPDTPTRRDRNCVTMQFSEFRLDVVPAFKLDTGNFKIPDTYRRLWVPTNPLGFAAKITEVNKTMGGSFIPLIKMVKGWNRNVGWPIRSFHLECLMHARYKTYTQSFTYSSMLALFFRDLPSYLQVACSDPVTLDRVDTYLDNNATKTNREIAIEKARIAAAASAKALDYENRGQEDKAVQTWKPLMGEFFPAYG